MPNGDPDFDLEYQEAWFAPIAKTIEAFAESHNLLIAKYYHDSPTWDLLFNHPKGGQARLCITNQAPDIASIDSAWHVDDYDRFTRFIHWRKPRDVAKTPDAIDAALREELAAILSVRKGDWNEVATDYERTWGRYTKEQFEAMAPLYPEPKIESEKS